MTWKLSVVGSGPILMPGKSLSSRYLSKMCLASFYILSHLYQLNQLDLKTFHWLNLKRGENRLVCLTSEPRLEFYLDVFENTLRYFVINTFMSAAPVTLL